MLNNKVISNVILNFEKYFTPPSGGVKIYFRNEIYNPNKKCYIKFLVPDVITTNGESYRMTDDNTSNIELEIHDDYLLIKFNKYNDGFSVLEHCLYLDRDEIIAIEKINILSSDSF